jgi:hypothetical protein
METKIKDLLKPFLTNLTVTPHKKYPFFTVYTQNDVQLFLLYDKKNGEIPTFYVNNMKIWRLFENLDINFNDIQSFIKKEVEETLKTGPITPIPSGLYVSDGW